MKIVLSYSGFIGSKEEKLEYALDNIDFLFDMSSKGDNRSWGGINSNGELHYYYKQLGGENKERFNNYIKQQVAEHPIIREKYGLE